MTEFHSALAVALAFTMMLARGFGLACWIVWSEPPMTRSLPESLPTDPDDDEVPEREYEMGEPVAVKP